MKHEVVGLQRSQMAEAAEMLAWAFQSDPIYCELFPESYVRHRALTATTRPRRPDAISASAAVTSGL